MTLTEFELLCQKRKAADDRVLKQLKEHGALLRAYIAEYRRSIVPRFSVYKGGKLIKIGGVR